MTKYIKLHEAQWPIPGTHLWQVLCPLGATLQIIQSESTSFCSSNSISHHTAKVLCARVWRVATRTRFSMRKDPCPIECSISSQAIFQHEGHTSRYRQIKIFNICNCRIDKVLILRSLRQDDTDKPGSNPQFIANSVACAYHGISWHISGQHMVGTAIRTTWLTNHDTKQLETMKIYLILSYYLLGFLTSPALAVKCPGLTCTAPRSISSTRRALADLIVDPSETARCTNADPAYCCRLILSRPLAQLSGLSDLVRNEHHERAIHVKVVHDADRRVFVYRSSTMDEPFWKVSIHSDRPNSSGTIQFQCQIIFGDRPDARYTLPIVFEMYCVDPSAVEEWDKVIDGERHTYASCHRVVTDALSRQYVRAASDNGRSSRMQTGSASFSVPLLGSPDSDCFDIPL